MAYRIHIDGPVSLADILNRSAHHNISGAPWVQRIAADLPEMTQRIMLSLRTDNGQVHIDEIKVLGLATVQAMRTQYGTPFTSTYNGEQIRDFIQHVEQAGQGHGISA